MLRTQYIVVERDGIWKIRFDGRHYGQYNTRRDALRVAIESAHNAAQRAKGQGMPPRVLAESKLRQELQTEWTYGKDPYPPHL